VHINLSTSVGYMSHCDDALYTDGDWYNRTGPSSAPSPPSWGRGTGRRGLTREVTERRMPDGQQWNVSLT
ncbi:hypothetical protein Taro_040796, partial [Colocasia esculenta]|nr:hypothetical protein [Colocasia esculenta]